MSAQRQQPKHLDDYVKVHSRVEEFRRDHPTARLVAQKIEDDPLTVRCEIYLDGNDSGIPNSTGMADEHGGMGNRGKMLEKIETASVGRALAFLGYGIREGLASQEDMDSRPRTVPTKVATTPGGPSDVRAVAQADDKQLVQDSYDILEAAGKLGYDGVKVKKWVNQKYGVANGLKDLTPRDRKEVLEVFRAQAQTKPGAAPNPSTAQSLADLVTPKQMGLIRARGREVSIDVDTECQRIMSCQIEELSRKAASSFIDHLGTLTQDERSA